MIAHACPQCKLMTIPLQLVWYSRLTRFLPECEGVQSARLQLSWWSEAKPHALTDYVAGARDIYMRQALGLIAQSVRMRK